MQLPNIQYSTEFYQETISNHVDFQLQLYYVDHHDTVTHS